MLPAFVLLIKLLGWVWAVSAFAYGKHTFAALRPEDLTECSVGPPQLLLAYRLAMLGWSLFIGLRQLLRNGRRVFIYFTVWNWWLLTAFFALGSAACLRVARRHPSSAKAAAARGVDWLGRATLATFCIAMPMSLALFLLTWFWLVPMVLSSADEAQTVVWRQRFYSFESYNQHGFNAVMVLGDLLLNRLPVDLYSSGWVALWSSLFGVWSALFYLRTGRFIYPFLDARKPYAWASYLGLFAIHAGAFFTVMAMTRAKQRFLSSRKARAGRSRRSCAADAPQRLAGSALGGAQAVAAPPAPLGTGPSHLKSH